MATGAPVSEDLLRGRPCLLVAPPVEIPDVRLAEFVDDRTVRSR
jgi:hypothetical protein